METTETIDKLKEVFTPIANKIGEGAQFGWEVVLRQQYVWAWISVFVASICFIVISGSIFGIYRNDKKGGYNDTDGVLLFISITALLVFVGSVIMAITHFLNPEYYAIQFFLDLVNNN